MTASKTIPTFLALYSFGFIYELVLVYDALRLKNTIQVIGLCLCNVGLLIYGAVQVQQIKEAVGVLTVNKAIDEDIWSETEPFLIIIPCVVAMGTLLMMIVAWKLYDEFAWSIYKHISADLRMKRRYLTYQVGWSCVCRRAPETDRSLDLHRSTQVRFFLLPRIYGPVRGDRHQPGGYRVRSDSGGGPGDHPDSSVCGVLRPARKFRRDDYYYCMFLRWPHRIFRSNNHLSSYTSPPWPTSSSNWSACTPQQPS